MLSWKPTCVIATPQNQVVGLRDDDQFFVLFHRGLRCSSQQQVEAQAVKITGGDFQISTAFGGKGERISGKGVKEISGKFWPDGNRH